MSTLTFQLQSINGMAAHEKTGAKQVTQTFWALKAQRREWQDAISMCFMVVAPASAADIAAAFSNPLAFDKGHHYESIQAGSSMHSETR